MVFLQLDIKNAFGFLCARLVLDVLSGKASRDYSCGIKVDEVFETAVHELRVYFGFFKLARACESVLRFYSYDGTTNYLKLKTGGGVLTSGRLDNGRGLARSSIFRHRHELESGRTSSITQHIMGIKASGEIVNYKNRCVSNCTFVLVKQVN